MKRNKELVPILGKPGHFKIASRQWGAGKEVRALSVGRPVFEDYEYNDKRGFYINQGENAYVGNHEFGAELGECIQFYVIIDDTDGRAGSERHHITTK